MDDEDGRLFLSNRPLFSDRAEAGRRLGALVRELRDAGDLGSGDLVVVGLPRGGVVVATEVARALGAPLDVVLVRKLGVPAQPELAMGAVGEDGARVVNKAVVRDAGVSPAQFAAVESRERAELASRIERYRAGRPRVPLAGLTVVVVDDGVATGSTARAACQVARAQGAAHLVIAVPVAPADWRGRFAGVAEELVCLATPSPFFGIGCFYAAFPQLTDEEVLALLPDGPSTAQLIEPRPPQRRPAPDRRPEGQPAQDKQDPDPCGSRSGGGEVERRASGD
jgi:predicted phosphoribosyltransferase